MTAFAIHSPRGLSTRPRWQALALTVAVEGAIVAAILFGASRHVQTEEPAVLSVNLMAPTPPPVVRPEPVKPDLPPPRAPSVAVPQLALPTLPEPAPAVPTPVEAVPVPPVARNVDKAPPAATPAAPPPPPPAASAAPSAEYIAKVRAAVQGAFEYPMAAKALDFKGRARVAFNLMDVRPGGARIVVSSGMAIVDRAALKAVESASYPAPPAELSHVDQAFEVWVNFGL